MKNTIYRLIFSTLLAIFAMQSCQSASADTSRSRSIDQMKTAFSEIPELLDRSGEIQNGKEWKPPKINLYKIKMLLPLIQMIKNRESIWRIFLLMRRGVMNSKLINTLSLTTQFFNLFELNSKVKLSSQSR